MTAFADAMKAQTRKVELAVLRTFQTAVGELGREMIRTRDDGGNMGKITGNLMRSQVASTSRGLPADELAERASGIFGADRVEAAPSLVDAIDRAVELADAAGPGAGVLIAGSVILAGEATALFARREAEADA